MKPVDVSFDELVRLFCERTKTEPAALKERLYGLQHFSPDGLMLLECQQMDSSSFGSRCILPFGGSSSLPGIPEGPFSPRGLASDMSVVTHVHWLRRPPEP